MTYTDKGSAKNAIGIGNIASSKQAYSRRNVCCAVPTPCGSCTTQGKQDGRTR
tara:strand:- start:243 stop:401 length:159 start_codon:yes stop_codon:yes gene_type:complete